MTKVKSLLISKDKLLYKVQHDSIKINLSSEVQQINYGIKILNCI